jgi:hypothetical protein
MKIGITIISIVLIVFLVNLSQEGLSRSPQVVYTDHQMLNFLNYCADWGDCTEDTLYEFKNNFTINCTGRVGLKPTIGKTANVWSMPGNITKSEVCNEYYGGATCIGDDCNFKINKTHITRGLPVSYREESGWSYAPFDIMIRCCKEREVDYEPVNFREHYIEDE